LDLDAKILVFGEPDFGNKVDLTLLFLGINDCHDIITARKVNLNLIVFRVLAFAIKFRVLVLLHGPVIINALLCTFVS
jgi:hypothetical protein